MRPCRLSELAQERPENGRTYEEGDSDSRREHDEEAPPRESRDGPNGVLHDHGHGRHSPTPSARRFLSASERRRDPVHDRVSFSFVGPIGRNEANREIA